MQGMRANLIGVVALMNLVVLQLRADDWVVRASMRHARGAISVSVAAFDDRIYVFGGSDRGFIGKTHVERYDPATNRWESLPDMPTPRSAAIAHVVGDEIFVFGGWNGGNELAVVEAFHPKSGQWTRKSDMPVARFGTKAFEHDGRIYLFGGVWRTPALKTSFSIYDPATDTWETKQGAPLHEAWSGGESVDGRFILIGGGTWDVNLSRVDRYDPATDTWDRGADMPTPRAGLATVAVGRRIVAIGGGLPPMSPVEIYDPVSDRWSVGPELPTPRLCPAAVYVRGTVYLIGGGGLDRQEVTAETLAWSDGTLSVSPGGQALGVAWGELKSRGRFRR